MFPLLSVEFTVSIAQTGGNVKRGTPSPSRPFRPRHLSQRARQGAPELYCAALINARFDRCLRRVKLAEGQLSALQTDEFR